VGGQGAVRKEIVGPTHRIKMKSKLKQVTKYRQGLGYFEDESDSVKSAKFSHVYT